MYKKIIVAIFALTMVLLYGCCDSSSAAEVGAYFETGMVNGETRVIPTDTPYGDVDYDFTTIGIQIETNPLSEDGVFSYRLQAGYERGYVEGMINFDAITLVNTLSFGKNISGNTRLWAGPQIELSRYNSETDETVFGVRVPVSGYMLGVGPAVGVNIKEKDGPTVTTTLGFRHHSSFNNTEDVGDIEGDLTRYFVSLGIMF
jgi:hypothetical protein